MSKNNQGLGKFLLGTAAVAAVAGLAIYAMADEDTRHHVQGVVNREKAKAYVKHKLNGSDRLVAIVDELSDAEINSLMKFANSSNQVTSKVSDGFNEIMKLAKDAANAAGDKVQDLLD